MDAPLARQAVTLRAWGLPEAGLLILMSGCDSRCFFCAHPGVTDPPPEMITRTDRVLRWLDANRLVGLRRLCLAGTEPPTHPGFVQVLERARAVGFEGVELMTSGLRLAPPGVAARWYDLGIRAVAAPLYAADPAIHDAVVGTEAFARTVAGLDAARDAGIAVHVHTLALVRTVAQLGPLARLVRDRWGGRLTIAPLRAKDTVAMPFAAEAVRFEALEAAIAELDVSLVGFPACAAPATPRGGALVIDIYFRGQARTFAPACADCSARETCPGVVAAYAAAFPADVRPVAPQPTRG